jgi:hypothetical protein
MSAWMALALAIIVVGGLVILTRLGLLAIAVGFWVAFAAGIAVLAASGHAMTARWHLGPITGFEFWRVLVFSPEILVFLFFMITDPKTIPASARGRRLYAVAIGLVAVLLIAPQTTEFATKVAVLAALAVVCAARPVGILVLERGRPVSFPQLGRARAWLAAFGAAAAFAGLVVLAGIPARTTEAAAGPVVNVSELPDVTVVPSDDVSTQLDRETALKIASDLVTGLRTETEALSSGDAELAATALGGSRLAAAFQQMSGDRVVPDYHVERVRLALEVGHGQARRSSSRTWPAPLPSVPTGIRARSRRRSSSSCRTGATSSSEPAPSARTSWRLPRLCRPAQAWAMCASTTSPATWGSTSATAPSASRPPPTRWR